MAAVLCKRCLRSWQTGFQNLIRASSFHVHVRFFERILSTRKTLRRSPYRASTKLALGKVATLPVFSLANYASKFKAPEGTGAT